MKFISKVNFTIAFILLLFATAIGDGLTPKAYQVMGLGIINLVSGFIALRLSTKELCYDRRNNDRCRDRRVKT